MFESSRARAMPRMVAVMAAVFVVIGMVIGGVFVGGMEDEIRRPARMLPMASRVIGLDSMGLFSSMGVNVGMRVGPVWTSTAIRRL